MPGPVERAAASGDSRELLIAMRWRIAAEIDNPDTPARDIASLTRRLMEVAREVEALDAREQEEAHGAVSVPDAEFDPKAV